MAELNRRALLAEQAIYKNHPARNRGAVAVSSPVPDYVETPMETYVRLVFAADERGRSLHNLAEKLLAKKKDEKNKKFFDPVYLGRDGADAKAAKFLLWRTMFPPPSMLGPRSEDSTPAESAPSESSTEPSPETSPTSSTVEEWASGCDSPDSTPPSEQETEQSEAPLPEWAELFTQETLTRDSTWALQNYAHIKTGKAKRRNAPSEMAWFLATLIDEDRKTFLQVVFKKAEQWADEQRKRDAQAEAEKRERARGDSEVLELLGYLEEAESRENARLLQVRAKDAAGESSVSASDDRVGAVERQVGAGDQGGVSA